MTLRELYHDISGFFTTWLNVLLSPNTWLDIHIGWMLLGSLTYLFFVYAISSSIVTYVKAVISSSVSMRAKGASLIVILFNSPLVQIALTIVLLLSPVILFPLLHKLLIALDLLPKVEALWGSAIVGFAFGLLLVVIVNIRIDKLLTPYDEAEEK